jgi:predicted ATPase/DNA-binding SARP family transcriptional activator
VRIEVLGPLQVLRDGHDVTPRGHRAVDVLARLALHPGAPVSSERLLDSVWAGPMERGADDEDLAVVHTLIARLRRRLGSAAVESGPYGYRLVNTVVDADEFLRDTGRVSGLVATGKADEAITLLRESLGRWRGDVAWWGVSDHLVSGERARLADERERAVEALADALLARGHPDDVAEAEHLSMGVLSRSPLRESAYALAMRAAYRAGRPADALATFRVLHGVLRRELGIEPGPDIRRLHAKILAQDPALDAVAISATRRPVSGHTPPPAPLGPLVGRELDLADLHRAALARRLVTVIGPAGVGKTSLLIELGALLAAKSRDLGTVVWVDLSGVGSVGPDDIAEGIARAAGVRVRREDPLAGVNEALAERPLVLLLDEAEWAVSGVATVIAAILRACPRVRAVVTSRRPLDVAGERLHVLAPLDCAGSGEAEEALAAEPSPAARLILDRLMDLGAEMDGESIRLDLIERAARRVDGLPLALELVAAVVAEVGVDHGLDALDHPLDVTASRLRRDDRHRSLGEALRWSTERLTPEDALVFRRLGVFVGSFDRPAAEAVVGSDDGTALDVGASLGRLVRDSLVHVDRESGEVQFRLLRTVRDVAHEDLSAAGDLALTRARHREWFGQRWRGAMRRDDLLLDVRRHHDDMVEALRTGLEDRDAGTVTDLVIALNRFWIFVESGTPALRWTRRVLASGLPSTLEQASLTAHLAAFERSSDPPAAKAHAEAALSVLEGVEDTFWLVTVHYTLALERLESGRTDEALEHARAAVAAGRRSSPDGWADGLSVLVVVLSSLGVDAAPRLRRELTEAAAAAARLVREVGSASSLLAVGSNLVIPLVESGQHAEALMLVDRLVEAIHRLPGLDWPTHISLNEGLAVAASGDHRRALQVLAAASSTLTVTDRWAAQIYAAATPSLVALRTPEAGEFAAGTLELLGRLELSLSAWQRSRLDEAFADLQSPGGSGPIRAGQLAPLVDPMALVSTELLGERLRDLLARAAARDAPN